MAYDKVIDSAKLESAITATADAIRAKTGSAEKIPWDESQGMAGAVRDIATGVQPSGTLEIVENGTFDVTEYASAEVAVPVGEGGPSAENVEFGNVKKVETEVASDGKLFYNDVILPEIPSEFSQAYTYNCIIRDSSDTNWVLLGCNNKMWFDTSKDTNALNQNAGEMGRRTYSAESDSWGELGVGNWYYKFSYVVWANYNIPIDSQTATAIYFRGSEPTTELTTSRLEPAERLEAYSTTGDFLNGVAGYVQKFLGTLSLLTPQGMLDGLAGVKFVPQGRASSEVVVRSGAFTSAVSGRLPVVERGIADSILITDSAFVSSAVGELTEV